MRPLGYGAVLVVTALWAIVAVMAIYAFGESLGYWRAMQWWEGCGA